MKSKIDRIISLFTILSPFVIYFIIRNFFPELLIFDSLVSTLENLYGKYGVLIIFVSGIAEAIFLLNMFIPGSIVILLGAVLASRGVITLPEVIIAGTVGLLIGYSFDWFVGRFGWYELISKTRVFKMVEAVEKRLKNQESFIIFLSGFNPNGLAIVSIAAGIIKSDYRNFIKKVALTQLAWSTFWGSLFFIFGIVMLKNVYWVVLVAIIIISITYFIKNKLELKE